MFNTKNEFKLTPCRPPEPCEYDDCGSDDDISDNDLDTFMEEEAERVEIINEKDCSNCNEGKEKKEKQDELTKKKETNGVEIERKKKSSCRKIIKNPFFTNRLKFSIDLPPPPPVPPPQFLPLTDEDSKPKVCPKKKKCKKKKKESKHKIGFYEDMYNEEDIDEESCEDRLKNENLEAEPVCNCCDEIAAARAEHWCGRRHKKTKDNLHFPCKKKVSDTSIPPQPRRIPAVLKELPLTCPKDIPEVKRQMQMSLECNFEKKCKKKNKEKVKKLLCQ